MGVRRRLGVHQRHVLVGVLSLEKHLRAPLLHRPHVDAGAPRALDHVNPADQHQWRATNTVFEDIALANAPQNFNLIGAGEPERLIAARPDDAIMGEEGDDRPGTSGA